MQKTLLLTLTACALVCALPTSALAGKGKNKGANAAAPGAAGKGANKEERKEKHAIFARYDKNSNDVLDTDEKEMIKKDFATDASLKVLDTDKDGQLSDAELNTLKAPHKKNK